MIAAERPIIMSADSVRAILDGRKTQTRRVVKPQPGTFGDNWIWSYHHRGIHGNSEQIARFMRQHSPYPVSSRWWVREVWNARDVVYDEYCGGYEAGYPLNPMPRTRPEYRYVVDYKATDGNDGPWRSPIHMPRWASRITLEVTGVMAERVQEITYDDIVAEGWNPRTSEPITDGTAGEDARAWYIALWDSINASRGYPWDSNPWVWVVEFRRVE